MSVSSNGAVPIAQTWSERLFKPITKLQRKNISNESLVVDITSSVDSRFEVHLVDGETMSVDLNRLRQSNKYSDVLIKDVVKEVCRKKAISPISTCFFGLRCEFSSGTLMWIVQTTKVNDVKQEKKKKFYFRLQFKVLFGQDLRKRDNSAYLYYLKQCRCDFKSGVFSKQLEGKDNERILLRIVILEMMMLYKEIVKEENVIQLKDMLKSKYRKYFSIDEILKKYYDRDGPRDMTRCRTKVEKSLSMFSKVTDPEKDFLTEIELLGNFREEVFHLQKYERENSEANPVELWISPRDIQKKVVMSNMRTTLWEAPYAQLHRLKFCEIDQKRGVKFMIMRVDEPPEVMYCLNEEMFETICSHADGYHRLLVNQYNSILHDSSQFLLKSPFFGPIHRDIAAKIISSKGVEPGTYLIREQQAQFGGYTLSCISDEHEFLHIQILRHEEDNRKFFAFYGSGKKFETLEDLCTHYSDRQNREEEVGGYLATRIPPKKAGSIPLYTDPAAFRPIVADKQSISRLQIANVQPTHGQILMLDESNITEEKQIKQGTFGKVSISTTCSGKQVVIKRLDTIKRDEVLVLYNILKATQHENIVALVGISLLNDMFLAVEYIAQGSLEVYLNENKETITYGALLKYAVQITEAVSFLHMQKFVHADLSLGNVYMQDVNTIKIGNGCIKWKLATAKSVTDVIYRKRFNFHAPEIILKKSTGFTQPSDVWSYGLTIWQLFTLECPFKMYSMEDLRTFFHQHMDREMTEEPGLVHLNMHKLPYCTDKLLFLLNSCLKMKPEDRLAMDGKMGIRDIVLEDILRTAPSKDKKKCYFTQDWSEEVTQNITPNHSNQHTMEVKINSTGVEDNNYTSAEALANCGGGYLVPDLSIVKNEEMEINTPVTCTNMQLNHEEQAYARRTNRSSRSAPSSPSRPRLQRSSSLNEEGNRGEEEIETASILVDMSQTKESEKCKKSLPVSNDIKQEMDAFSESSLYVKDTSSWAKVTDSVQMHPTSTPCAIVSNPLSLPMSQHVILPTSHAILRPPMIHAASYALPRHPTSLPISQPTLFPISYTNSCPTSNDLSQPTPPRLSQSSTVVVRPIAIPLSQTSPPHMMQTSHRQSPDSTRLTPSPSMPQDSPEAVRREFASEHTKNDLPRNERTRLYLKERINKERDRFHGKRSLSFTDEFEEYKNNTIRAAKRALLGPNPFNIGIHLPDNFLLRKPIPDRTFPPMENRDGAAVNAVTQQMSKMDTHSNSPSPRSLEEVAKRPNEHPPFSYQISNQKNPRQQGMVVGIGNPLQPPPLQPPNRLHYHPRVLVPCQSIPQKQGPPVVSIPPGYSVREQSVLFVNPFYNESPYTSEAELQSVSINTAGKCLQIDKNSLRPVKRLGFGAFGQVWKGVWTYSQNKKSHPINVAIKRVIDCNDPDYDKAVDDLRAEANHLAALNNDNDPASNHIIKLYGTCIDDGVYQIVEEFAQHGQLDVYIAQKKNHINNGDILNFCKQVAVGMDYIHKKNVFHRDLACRNILVTAPQHVKISDFGMSRQPDKEYYKMREGKKLPIKWCALESITRMKFTTETDVWSYGVAVWEMYTVYQDDYHEHHARPYHDVKDNCFSEYLEKGNRLLRPKSCPENIWNRLCQCWHAEPKQRPTFRELKDFFFKSMEEIGYIT